MNLTVPDESGEIVHIVPGRLNTAKMFVLTDEGNLIYLAEDGGLGHIHFKRRSKSTIALTLRNRDLPDHGDI